MRAISFFNLEAGTSTFAWRAMSAFLTRVSISAMGSAVITSFQHLSLFLMFQQRAFRASPSLVVTSSPSLRQELPRPGRTCGNRYGTEKTYEEIHADGRSSCSGYAAG